MSEIERVGIGKLYKEHKLEFSKVVSMLESEKTYKFINTYLRSKNLEMSNPTLGNLKSKIQESKEKGISLDSLIDMNKKKSIKDVNPDKIKGFKPKGNDTQYSDKVADEVVRETGEVVVKNKVYNPRQILEEIMNKGFDTLQKVDYIDMNTMLKAADLYNKYYHDQQGLTTEAIKNYQILINATLNAMKETIIKYVPEKDQKEAFEEMENKRKEYLEQFGSTADGKRLLEEFDKANLTY